MSADIVPIDAARLRCLDPAIAQVEAYWDGLRAGRLAPARAEVDPRGLMGVLAQSFVIERVATGFARFRVAGRTIGQLLDTEMQGLPISTLFTPESRDTLERALADVFDAPAIVRMSVGSPGRIGAARLSGQMTVLPLRSDLGDISRALGAISLDGEIGRRPRRLEIERVSQLEILRGQPIPASETVKSQGNQDAPDGSHNVVRLHGPGGAA